jgi:hypothetical protein
MLVHADPKGDDIFTKIVKEGANPATVLAEWEPVCQGFLDELLGQK